MEYTTESLQQSILDNADWVESASPAKAQAFATAVMRWLAISPEAMSDQGSSLTLGRDQLADLRREALQFVAANTAGGAVRHLGVGGQFRR